MRFQSDDYQALQGMAASGIGVAMIPTMALVSSRSDVVVLPVRGRAPARQIIAAVRSGEEDPLVEHMVESLRAASRTLAGGRRVPCRVEVRGHLRRLAAPGGPAIPHVHPVCAGITSGPSHDDRAAMRTQLHSRH